MKKWQTIEEALLWLKRNGLRLDRKNPLVASVELKGKAILSALDFLKGQKLSYAILEKGKAQVLLTPAYSQLLAGPLPTKN